MDTITNAKETVKSLPDYAPIPKSALGPALNEQGYYVGRVEKNLYWVTDGVYQSAFLTTKDGVVLLDAPPTIGGNLQRAVDEIASANGVSNKITHLIYSHHHADHAGASSLFSNKVVRIGHEETRKLLLRDNDAARPAPEETFQDHRTLEIGGERIELAWHGSNHSPSRLRCWRAMIFAVITFWRLANRRDWLCPGKLRCSALTMTTSCVRCAGRSFRALCRTRKESAISRRRRCTL